MSREESQPLRITIEIKTSRSIAKATCKVSETMGAKMHNAEIVSLGENIAFPTPTRGLVIMARPLEQILDGTKTLELRSKPTRQLGTVALIRKRSKQIFGIATLSECIGPMNYEEFCRRQPEHGVSSSRLNEVYDQRWIYGWRMKNVLRLRQPVSYVHRGMSQVKLDAKAIADIDHQVGAGAYDVVAQPAANRSW